MKILIGIFFITCMSCNFNSRGDGVEKSKLEILKTEKLFQELVTEKGMKIGFLYYAAEDAVLIRGNKLIKGRQEIEKYFEKTIYKNIKLSWKPDFVEVSKSGDFGYTYGKYTFKANDKSGNLVEDEGIFHTVWKRQEDGCWKFVWD